MGDLKKLIEGNRAWAKGVRADQPEFFTELAKGQAPEYLWIGCADSRVPANMVLDLPPGSVFVHRNVANVVAAGDINMLSVLQYAVEVLKVKHVIVCGHYGCGGVAAALSRKQFGPIDEWLRNIKDVYLKHQAEVDGTDDAKRADRMCEINAEEQALHVASTTIVQDAWERGQDLSVHGVVFALKDGTVNELGCQFSSAGDLPEAYRIARS